MKAIEYLQHIPIVSVRSLRLWDEKMFQYDVGHMTKTTATPIHGESR